MTHVASLELCRELYELSGWRDLRDWWWGDHLKGGETRYRLQQNAPLDKCGRDDVPAYDLGYVLRKLPSSIDVNDDIAPTAFLEFRFGSSDLPTFMYESYNYELWDRYHESSAETFEDAATKLAIELFKQGVLTRSES